MVSGLTETRPWQKKRRRGMKRANQTSPIRWFLLLWVGLVYLQSVQTALSNLNSGPKGSPSGAGGSPQLDLVMFTLLLACLGGLLWITFSLQKTRDLLLSLLGQGILVLLIAFLAHAENAILGLCLALTIEAITLYKQTRMVLLVGGGCLLLFGVTEGVQIMPVVATGSLQKLSGVLFGSLTLILFAIACVLLYLQQGQAHQRDQALLQELETAHTELKTAHQQLEDYAMQVEDLTLIAERQRLARELHDTLAQGLVGLTMQLETIDALLLKHNAGQARAIVQQAMARARATMTQARSAIEDLRSDMGEGLDFAQSVQRETQRFTAATGIPCTSSLPETLALSTSCQEHLVRVVSEGLLNIARHAQATHAWVCATSDREELTLEIGDDGIGFDPVVVTQPGGHYGLLGLRERARLLKGNLCIKSAPGQGTTIRLQFPASLEGAEP